MPTDRSQDLPELYRTRFSPIERERKRALWGVLCRAFFQRYVKPSDAVLDLGAGYCDFINQIDCRTRIAVDLNPDTPAHAAPGVRVIAAPSTNLEAIGDGAVDVVFASNFFEHLPNKDEFLATLREVKRVLSVGGRLLILQPNIRLLHGEYWDFVDHHLPLTDRTLVEALELVGLRPVDLRVRFLPYTTKSRFPQYGWLVRLYLLARPLQWWFGKQTWLVAVKDRGTGQV